MEKLRIYISGKMSGLLDVVVRFNFMLAELQVRMMVPNGNEAECIIPSELPPIEGDAWTDYIIRDLELLKCCDAIAMQPNWKDSPGAIVERDFAYGMGIPVYYLEEDSRYIIKTEAQRLTLFAQLANKSFQNDPQKAIRLQRKYYTKDINLIINQITKQSETQ